MTNTIDDVSGALATKLAAISGIRGAGTDSEPVSLPYFYITDPTLSLLEMPPQNELWDWVYPCLLMAPQYADLTRAKVQLRSFVVPTIEAFYVGRRLGLQDVQDSFVNAAAPDVVNIGAGDNLPAYRFDIVVRQRVNVTRSST